MSDDLAHAHTTARALGVEEAARKVAHLIDAETADHVRALAKLDPSLVALPREVVERVSKADDAARKEGLGCCGCLTDPPPHVRGKDVRRAADEHAPGCKSHELFAALAELSSALKENP